MPQIQTVISSTELLRVPEGAEFLAIKTATLRAWILQGKIPYIRLSARAIRLRKSDLEKILERRFVPAREPAAAAR